MSDSLTSSQHFTRQAELDGGNKFAFYLVVSSRVAKTSALTSFNITRQSLPIPTIFIDAPPLLYLLGTTSMRLSAAAAFRSSNAY